MLTAGDKSKRLKRSDNLLEFSEHQVRFILCCRCPMKPNFRLDRRLQCNCVLGESRTMVVAMKPLHSE